MDAGAWVQLFGSGDSQQQQQQQQWREWRRLAEATKDSFNHCDAAGEDDVCDACARRTRRLCAEYLSFLERAEQDRQSLFRVSELEGRVFRLGPLMLVGGYSHVFACEDVRAPDAHSETRGELRASRFRNGTHGWVLKVNSLKRENARCFFLDYVMARMLATVAPESSICVPACAPFFLPMQGHSPPWRMATLLPRYLCDVFELVDLKVATDTELFAMLAFLCDLLDTLQTRARFVHRDLKIDNVFVRLVPPSDYTVRGVTFSGFRYRFVLGDLGMSRMAVGKRILSCNVGSGMRDAFNRGEDLCFLLVRSLVTMADGGVDDLSTYAPAFHKFLHDTCTRPSVLKYVEHARLLDQDASRASEADVERMGYSVLSTCYNVADKASDWEEFHPRVVFARIQQLHDSAEQSDRDVFEGRVRAPQRPRLRSPPPPTRNPEPATDTAAAAAINININNSPPLTPPAKGDGDASFDCVDFMLTN